MKVYQTYRDFVNNPWVIVGFGIIATLGYVLDSFFYDSSPGLKTINYVCAGATFLTLLYFVIRRNYKYTILKFFAGILWVDLFLAPFVMFEYTSYESFYFRNTLFYWSLLPIVALMFGTKEYIAAVIVFFMQFSLITYLTQNSYLVESFVTITIVLFIYTFIIYAFVMSINHYLDFQVEAQEKLRIQSRELHHSNKTKSKLLSIIGHDLRSPLMSLASLSVLIEDETRESKNDELKELIGILNTTVDQTAFLVTNLLEWSRTQENRITVDLKPIRIEPFLKSLKDLLGFSLNNKDLYFNIGPIEAVEVFADQNLLQTILRNLVTNSIKFTPSGGEVSISTTNADDGSYIIIKDTGVGMDEDTISKLLDMETYASQKGTDQEKGSGIGFNLCMELMQLQHGTIEIKSTPNEGTELKLFFPDIEKYAELSEESDPRQ